MSRDTQTNPREFAQAIEDLRDEMQRDVRGLASSLERRPRQQPGVSPLAYAASVLGSLFVGAAGMSWYDSPSEPPSASVTPPVDVRAELQAAMSPYTQQLEKLTESLVAAQQSAAEDSRAHGLLLDGLSETVTSLQKYAEVQHAAFDERVELLADELAAKIAHGTPSGDSPTVAARQPVPDSQTAAVQPATAETEVAAGDDDAGADQRPVAPATSEPERGELIISNPSEYDLKLLINGRPMDIKARGVTTIDVTVGTVKTQIASLPEVAQTWNNWETVEGVKRLTINVESGNGYYKLR